MSTSDRGPVVFIVCLVVVCLATVFTALRLISKWGVTKKSNADDWLVLVAWIFTVAVGVSVMVGTQNGLGKHDAAILPSDVLALKRSIYAFTIFYNPALMATKSAILLLYLRMSTAHPFLKIASWVVLVIVNLAGVVLTFLNAFQCRPVSAAYTNTPGKCIDLVGMYLSSAPVNVATDLAILLLPLPLLTALRIEFRQKVVLVATFIVGGFVTLVDIVRIVYLQTALEIEVELNLSGASATSRPPDFIFEVSFTLMWSTVEVAVGLMCACVLVLKPLVMRVLPGFLQQSSSIPDHPLTDLSKPTRSPVQRLAPVFEEPFTPRPDDDEDDDAGPMDFMQMLSTNDPPATHPPADLPVSPTTQSRKLSKRSMSIFQPHREIPEPNQQPTQNFFDFVNMGGQKPLTQLTTKEAWWPVLFVSTLFFLWGFSYGLLGTLNGEIQSLMRYSPSKSIALHSAYWLGYVAGPPLVGYWTLTRSSFKSTFIAGLCLYSVGALSFWPSSVLLSYPGFFISNFIIATGLSTLEVAANPFIALAGPSHLSEARLNFAQGIQAVGSVLSPILAKRVLFVNLSRQSLFNVQWCYLAVALVVVALAVVFFYVPLSEAPDDELEAQAQQALLDVGLEAEASLTVFGLHISARGALLAFGTIGMFIYVGAQETISYFWAPISTELKPTMDPFWVQAIAHSVFALGRFVGSAACWAGVPPRLVLLVCIAGAFVTSLLALTLQPGSGAMGMFILITFFESAIFPTLFAITMRHQGVRTKLTSTILVTAVCGGGVLPVAAYGAQQAHLGNPRYSLVVVVVLYGVSLVVPGWLCGGMRKWVDPQRPIRARRRLDEGGSGSSESGTAGSDGKPHTAHVELRPATSVSV